VDASLVPYIVYTSELYGSTEPPEPEEYFTVDLEPYFVGKRPNRDHPHRRRRRRFRRRFTRRVRWDDPLFPLTTPAGTTQDLIVDFAIPMESVVVEPIPAAFDAMTYTVSPGRVTIRLTAGASDEVLQGIVVSAVPYMPMPDGEVSERTATADLLAREPAQTDDTYVSGPGQAEGLARYRVWRWETSRMQPVVRDALRPDRQLVARVGDTMALTVTKYRIDDIRCTVRGVTHRIGRPMPWYTEYALEELPTAATWVAIDGGADLGIGSSAHLAY
jgi:hypothetical protein